MVRTFRFRFEVDAPLESVREFHSDTRALRILTPPPLFVTVSEFGEMREGMLARFTLWLGPFPIRWVSKHVDVGPHGFTDVQVRGPAARWRHTHRFTSIGERRTRLEEFVEYAHPGGFKGILSRALFNPAGLWLLFQYRALRTRWALQKRQLSPAN